MGYGDNYYTGNSKNKQLTMSYIYNLNGVVLFWSNKKTKTIIVFSTKMQ